MPSLEIEMPDQVPVMTMGGTVLFPQTFMHLYIFERRYRRMLADALSSNRIFIVANRADGQSGQVDVDCPPCSVATAGIIRMSTLNNDGTSNVILQGLSRIIIERIVQERPYRLVKIRPLPPKTPISLKDLDTRQQQLLNLMEARERLGIPSPNGIRQIFDNIDNVDSIADLAAHALCQNAAFKQRLLETLDTAQRLDLIIDSFRRDLEKEILGKKLDDLLGQDEVTEN